ncbi:MAG: hypothetical protein GY749_30925 [Desulfobacteraceae bacterium]|nr:hypothetical protein [Desulfobacteraceae bacterium]
MKTYNFTDGKKEIKTYREVSNIEQGYLSKDETLRTFKTDILFENEQYDTRFEEVKN